MSAEYYPPPRPIGRLPLGVAILAILIGIVGFFYLLVSIFGFLSLAFLHTYLIYGLGLVAAFITFLIGIILLVVAGGLWNQRLWALALAIIVVILLLVGSIFGLFANRPTAFFSAIVEGLLLIYLIAVSGHFR